MGGTGSGRWGGRPTVEQAKALPITGLMGRRTGAERQGWRGTWEWRSGYTNEITMRLAWLTFIDGNSGWVELEHAAARRGEVPQVVRYRIPITGVRQPFGGLRWFFVCPTGGGLVTKLYLPLGGLRFASREAYRLGYRSQRESPRDRASSRYWKARQALMSEDETKRKFMHWRTFDAGLDDLAAKERALDGHFMAGFQKRGRLNDAIRKAAGV